MLVMKTTRHRSDAHPEGFADPTVGPWSRRRDDEAGLVGK
jgi:hypothetical protein